MPVSFNNIPSNLKSPLFYAEMDNSKAGTFTARYRTLLIGQALNTENIEYNKALYVSTLSQAKVKCGTGSQISQMVEAYLKNNSSVDCYILPLSDPQQGSQASGSITITGNSIVNGTLSLYIYDMLVQSGISAGDTPEVIVKQIAENINKNVNLPVTATTDANTVNVIAKHKGVIGNDIIMSLNLGGDANGEVTPKGLTIEIKQLSGGSGQSDIDTAIANIGEEQFDFIVSGLNSSGVLKALSNYMNDKTGNWSYTKQLYGHIWTAYRGGVSECQTFGSRYNDQHLSIIGINGTHSPIWAVASALAGTSAVSIASDPARPLQTLQLLGISAPDVSERFILTERESLLNNGISTYTVNSGIMQIDRVITTYQKNAYGQVDNSYLSVETMYQSAYVLRKLRNSITSKYGRHKLAKDGTRFGEGQAIATPKTLKAELITVYEALAYEGIVEDVEEFKKNLIVEINENDRNRVDVLFTPDYVNQLNIFALVNQFRL